MNRAKRYTLMACAAALLLAPPAATHAADFHVAPSGDDAWVRERGSRRFGIADGLTQPRRSRRFCKPVVTGPLGEPSARPWPGPQTRSKDRWN